MDGAIHLYRGQGEKRTLESKDNSEIIVADWCGNTTRTLNESMCRCVLAIHSLLKLQVQAIRALAEHSYHAIKPCLEGETTKVSPLQPRIQKNLA